MHKTRTTWWSVLVVAACSAGCLTSCSDATDESAQSDPEGQSLQGELKRVLISSPDSGQSRFDYFLELADGRPLMLRFGHEMNGDWYGWSGARNGGSLAAPEQFVATWQYVHRRFTSAGATNVTWVWCVNHESVPNASWNVPENYYPGDAYVDWTCADGYRAAATMVRQSCPAPSRANCFIASPATAKSACR